MDGGDGSRGGGWGWETAVKTEACRGCGGKMNGGDERSRRDGGGLGEGRRDECAGDSEEETPRPTNGPWLIWVASAAARRAQISARADEGLDDDMMGDLQRGDTERQWATSTSTTTLLRQRLNDSPKEEDNSLNSTATSLIQLR